MGPHLTVAALGCVCSLALSTAHADSLSSVKQNSYVGGSLGVVFNPTNDADIVRRVENNGHTNVAASIDGVAPGFEIYAGYRLSDLVAIEASYINLGNFDLQVSGNTRPGASTAEFNRDALLAAPQSIAGLGMSSVFRPAITPKFNAIIETGFTYWRYSVEDRASGSEIKDNGVSITIGCGAGYRISDQLEVNAVLTLNESDVLLPYVAAGLTYSLK